MTQYTKRCMVAFFATLLWCCTPVALADSRWGADYFPNIELTDHNGKTVRFFDDLIKDKTVVINFIYTTCPDTCPLETAHLVRVQRIMGDRLGKDVFFYSISIDPEKDTPPVLKEYRERFRAKWSFYTGNKLEIVQLRKKLGLYITEIQDGSNNHNVSMIIGNQKTGRWMKRSPFENAHVLANQIGSWLDDWKAPPKGDDYAKAPELRNISTGEQMFRTRCITCHSITGHEEPGALGPDLLGVSQRRTAFWLLNWLRAPDQMIKNKDPIAMGLLKQYNNLAMPNMRLNQLEARELITYINEETKRVQHSHKPHNPNDVVAVNNAWVREALPKSKVNAGYMTLENNSAEDVTLVAVSTEAYGKVEFHQMTMTDGMMDMQALDTVQIPAKGKVNFVPGGKHLMLHQPKQDFVKGQNIKLTLNFKSGKSQQVTLKVDDK